MVISSEDPARAVRSQARERLLGVTSPGGPTDDLRADEPVQTGRPAADPRAVRELVDRLHQDIDKAFDAWNAEGSSTVEKTPPVAPTFARPVAQPPVRMEQLARTPEPTADLDDLVDLLVPRLVEMLVPALREALRDD